MENRYWSLLQSFYLPLLIALGIVFSVFAHFLIPDSLTYFPIDSAVLIFCVIMGSFDLVKETLAALLKRKFALDYIALLAITVGMIDGQYLVAAVITLMLTGGQALEAYAMQRARKSLTALVDRIPHEVILAFDGQPQESKIIESVEVGEMIFIRKGEVIPLDGVLLSESTLTDESSLTGEPFMIEKFQGDLMRSGTINQGEAIVVRVTKRDQESTYRSIINMVKAAQDEKAPLIRLADRYSTIFTIITFTIAGLSYFFTQDLGRVLAVLVIATPCPLILATPIALIGGMNASARQRIILKNLTSLEVLSRIDTIVFDKTGTLTLGSPRVQRIELFGEIEEDKALSIAAAIERNSLHPFAKAVTGYARDKGLAVVNAQNVQEEIGHGIYGEVQGTRYGLSKVQNIDQMAIQLTENEQPLAYLYFEDQLKTQSKETIKRLSRLGIELHIFTGDKKSAAEEVLGRLGIEAQLSAEMKPEEKLRGIEALREKGRVVAMVGDGINDAPALAKADVGMVFSNEQHTAASEAADIVFLGGEFEHVLEVMMIGKRTIRIALQSIVVGIGLSVVGMLFAAFGFIPSVVGAFMQEGIDILVILNALRAAYVGVRER